MNSAFYSKLLLTLAGGLLSVALGGAGCTASSDSTTTLSDDGGTPDGASQDSAGPSDGAMSDGGSSCVPGDVSDLKPTWHRPTPFYQDACTAQEISTYLASCVGNGDKDACTNGVRDKCAQCIGTADTADRYGPLIVHSGWVELNVAGCLSNAMNDPTGVKCAASVQALRACELAACGPNCPVTSDATLATYVSCAKQVDDGQCKPLVQDAACIGQLADAGSEIAACLGSSFEAVVTLFCGASPGGPDAGAGGG